jgi:methyl-accepting chemotaxis protein
MGDKAFKNAISNLNFFKKLSITFQVLIPILIVLIFMFFYCNKVLTKHQYDSTKALVSERVAGTLSAVSKSSLAAIRSYNKNMLNRIASDVMSDKTILAVSFHDKNGKPITPEPSLEAGTYFSVSKTVAGANKKPAGAVTAYISNEYVTAKVKDALQKNTLLTIQALLAVLLAFLIIFNFTVLRPLHKINGVISRLSSGDLTAKISAMSTGEIRAISESLSVMVEKLNELVSTIVKNSSLLASSSEEFSATSQENVRGASEQTDKINKAFKSIQVFHEAIDGIFTNSEAADKEAKEATDSATNGQKIITNTMEKMEHTSQSVTNAANKVNELGESSKQIGNITAVIREITNKTNLLALNAAIEAARAGEHGLGFAVVADEVRKLAERTSKATKEIETTILNIQGATESVVELMGNTTSEVEESAGLVQNAGGALNQINQKIQRVSEEIKSIVSAIEIQRETTDGIVTDIERVSNVAQGFSVNAQEASKASNELSKMAGELETTVHSFKVSTS